MNYNLLSTGNTFTSVLLPNIGDGVFTVSGVAGGASFSQTVSAGTAFNFASGVTSFSVGGIELSAGLDPTDTTAFVTGLTFSSAGNINMTQTPITEFVAAPVPEPETYAMMLAGLGLIGFSARRKKTSLIVISIPRSNN